MATTTIITNVRVLPAVLIGTGKRTTFAIVPRDSPTKSRFFEISLETHVITYTPGTVICSVPSAAALDNKRGRKERALRVAAVYDVIRDMKQAEFDALDVVHVEVTLVDMLPEALAFAIKEPQGPVLKKIVFKNPATAKRTDELRILRDLSFGMTHVFWPNTTFPETIEIPDDKLCESIQLKTAHDLEVEALELKSKYEAALSTRLDKLVEEGRVVRTVAPESIAVDIQMGIRNLRDFVPAHVKLCIEEDEPRVIAEKTLSAVLSCFEAVITGEEGSKKPKRQRRGSSGSGGDTSGAPPSSIDDELHALQMALFGPRRIMDVSLWVAVRTLTTNPHAMAEDDKTLIASLKIKFPPSLGDGETHDPEFIEQMHAFVTNERAFQLLLEFVSTDATVDLASHLVEARAKFLEMRGTMDEAPAALANFQLEEHAAAYRDRHMLPVRKAFRNLKRAVHIA